MTKEFEEAAKKVRNADPNKLSNEQKLSLYALYKQATDGENHRPEPSKISVSDHAKWDAWKKLGAMSKEEAQKKYIEGAAKL